MQEVCVGVHRLRKREIDEARERKRREDTNAIEGERGERWREEGERRDRERGERKRREDTNDIEGGRDRGREEIERERGIEGKREK